VFSATSAFFAVGVYSIQGLALVNVSANATGAGFNYGATQGSSSTMRLVNARLVATGGMGSFGLAASGVGTVNVDRSTVSGSSLSVSNQDTANIRLAVSQLVNPVNNGGGGSISCLSSYNGAYNPLNASCQ
jgi:hypothetical protein